jgi:hypothetical protein
VVLRFPWKGGDVNASKEYEGSLPPVCIGNLIRPAGIGDVDLNCDHIWRVVQIQSLDMLVHNLGLIPVRKKTRQGSQAKRRKKGVLDRPPEGAIRFHQ